MNSPKDEAKYYHIKIKFRFGAEGTVRDMRCKYINIMFDKLFDEDKLDQQTIYAYCVGSDQLHLLIGSDSGKLLALLNNINNFGRTNLSSEKSLFISDKEVISIENIDEAVRTSKALHCLCDTCVGFPYSSIRAYLYEDYPQWLDKQEIMNKFESAQDYMQFLTNKS